MENLRIYQKKETKIYKRTYKVQKKKKRRNGTKKEDIKIQNWATSWAV